MILVRVEDNNLEFAIRRFKKKCERSGLLAELKKRRFYEKPSVRKRKKSALARKRRFQGR